MRSYDWVLIGGTGIGSRMAKMGSESVWIPTPFGSVRGISLKSGSQSVLCLQRHSSGHKVPPHKVNYRAMASAAALVKAKGCLSTAAVGCLNPAWRPGTLVICSDFIDLTFRSVTMFDRAVAHADFSHPMALREMLQRGGQKLGVPLESGGVYVGLDGPRYETPAEIEWVRRTGGNLVGMTASTEAECFGEAKIPYACLAIVTNLASGMSEGELSHTEVVDVMESVGPKVVELLLCAVENP
ncbi:MAG: MTAP family purine nucleoside phosphorylase [Armatimonadetes bacterium]|nr:MTAP family purine nucleoside phosphorylase [Armatimonadota bacterium]